MSVDENLIKYIPFLDTHHRTINAKCVELMCIQVHSNPFEPFLCFLQPDDSMTAGENQVSLEAS